MNTYDNGKFYTESIVFGPAGLRALPSDRSARCRCDIRYHLRINIAINKTDSLPVPLSLLLPTPGSVTSSTMNTNSDTTDKSALRFVRKSFFCNAERRPRELYSEFSPSIKVNEFFIRIFRELFILPAENFFTLLLSPDAAKINRGSLVIVLRTLRV